jgi:purine-binding chemotaxis protein CheW
LRIPKNAIQPPLKFSAQSGEQLKGIAKLSNGKRMIFILEPSKIISADILDAIIVNDDTDDQNSDGQNADDQNTDGQNAERQILDEAQFVTFKIDDEEYGIKIDNVQEINRMTEVTKIPNGPYYIEGIVNLRGNIIPALDLRRLFKLSEKQLTDATRIIIADFNGKRTGIIVDSVSEVLRFEKKLIEAPTEILSNGIDSDYIEGVGKLDDGNRMILILDVGKVLRFS